MSQTSHSGFENINLLFLRCATCCLVYERRFGSCMCIVAAVWQGLTGVLCMQTAAEMFVMVLDVHKWVPLPAIAARAKQSSSAAVPAGTLAAPVCPPVHQPILWISIA